MDQLDTLCSLKEKFEEDKQQNGKEPTKALELAIEGNIELKQQLIFLLNFC
jgi:hypothetical protein